MKYFAVAVAVVAVVYIGQGLAASAGMYSQVGDINIGLVLPIHKPNTSSKTPYDLRYACGELDGSQMMQTAYLIKMVEYANAFVKGAIKFGFSIIDSCSLPSVALSRASGWAGFKIADTIAPGALNASNEFAPVTFALGGYNSRVSLPLTMYLQLYDIPLIDTGATLGDLSDRRRYRQFARVQPSDRHQSLALAEVAQKLGHKCVHVVYSQGLYGELGAEDLRKSLRQMGICIASDQMAPTLLNSTSSDQLAEIIEVMKVNKSAPGVICFCEDTTLEALLRALVTDKSNSGKASDDEKARFSLIASDYWSSSFPFTDFDAQDIAEGATTITVGAPANGTYMPLHVDEVVAQLNSSSPNPWLVEYFEHRFQCKFNPEDPTVVTPCDLSIMVLANEDFPQDPDAQPLYTGFMAGMQGVYTLLTKECQTEPLSTPRCIKYVNEHPEELLQAITKQQVQLDDFGQQSFSFDAQGEGPAIYTFTNIQKQAYENDDGSVSNEYSYVDLAVWSGSTTMSVNDTTLAKAKLWPGTTNPIQSVCQCSLTPTSSSC